MLNFKKWLAEQNTPDDFPKSRFNLKPAQVAAIKRYRSQGFMYDIKGSRKTLEDLIGKAPPTKHDTVVYRGLRSAPKMDKAGLHINDKLVSTTLDLSFAKGFAGSDGHVVTIKIPAKSRVLNLTDFGEKEILIKPQSRLKYNLVPKNIDGKTFWEATLVFDGSKK
jgi:hypothetical protein